MPRGTDIETLLAGLPEELQQLPVLSYSQMMTADRCNFLWYMKYDRKMKNPGAPNKRMDTGGYVHAFLDDLYKCVISGEMDQHQWVEKRMNYVMADLHDSMKFPDQITSLSAAMQIVRRYASSYDILGGHTPVGSEEHFLILVVAPSGRQFLLQGYTDLITIDSNNQVWIWDHKSPERLWPRERYKMMLQLPTYLVMLRQDGIPVHGVCVNLLNSYVYAHPEEKKDEELFERKFLTYTPTQIQRIWSEFLALADEVLDLFYGKRNARRSIRDESCYQCELKRACNANLAGEPLETAMQTEVEVTSAFRSMPIGTEVILDLES